MKQRGNANKRLLVLARAKLVQRQRIDNIPKSSDMSRTALVSDLNWAEYDAKRAAERAASRGSSTETHRPVYSHKDGKNIAVPKSRDAMIRQSLNPKNRYHIKPRPNENRSEHVARVRRHVDWVRSNPDVDPARSPHR